MKPERIIVPALLIIAVCFTACGNGIEIKWQRHNVQVKECRPTLKVYIENSGSMDGYMDSGSEFKDAVYDYVSSLSNYSSKTQLNYINSQITRYKGDIHQFIWNLTPQIFAKIAGSHANSEIGEMLKAIISQTGKNTVSIFVSDCILDVPQGDAAKFFGITKTDIKNIILGKVVRDKDFAVEIIQLQSKFTGNYYGSDGITKLAGQVRPYYIWVMGDKDKLAYLNSQVKLSAIQHGYSHYVSFSTPSEIAYDVYNQFNVTCKSPDNVSNRSLKINKGRDGYTILVKANLYPTLIDDRSIIDAATYKSTSPSVKVTKAEIIDDEQFPHLLTLNISPLSNSTGEMITISNNDLPSWVSQCNDDTGKDIMRNISKTSGIKYIIGGVSDAYSSYKEKAAIKFTVSK